MEVYKGACPIWVTIKWLFHEFQSGRISVIDEEKKRKAAETGDDKTNLVKQILI